MQYNELQALLNEREFTPVPTPYICAYCDEPINSGDLTVILVLGSGKEHIFLHMRCYNDWVSLEVYEPCGE